MFPNLSVVPLRRRRRSPISIWRGLPPGARTLLTAAAKVGRCDAGHPDCDALAAAALVRWSIREAAWVLTDLGQQVAAPPVLFLDMDGVVARVIEHASGFERIDPAAVAKLNRVVAETGAVVVSSSTWRTGVTPEVAAQYIGYWLGLRGFVGEVVSATPELGPGRRGEEVEAWLRAQPHPPRAVAVLDDWEPMGAMTPWCVYTDEKTLLTDHDVDRVIDVLCAERRWWRP